VDQKKSSRACVLPLVKHFLAGWNSVPYLTRKKKKSKNKIIEKIDNEKLAE